MFQICIHLLFVYLLILHKHFGRTMIFLCFFICLFVYLFVCLYVCLLVCLFVCMFVYLFVCLFIYLSECDFIYLGERIETNARQREEER